MLQLASGSNTPRGDKVLEGEFFELLLSQTSILDLVVDGGSGRVWNSWIIPQHLGVLLVVQVSETLKPFGPRVVRISSKGDKARRRQRSIGSRNFEWRMGQQWKGQQLMLLLGAYPRHTLLWSSLPLCLRLLCPD